MSAMSVLLQVLFASLLLAVVWLALRFTLESFANAVRRNIQGRLAGRRTPPRT